MPTSTPCSPRKPPQRPAALVLDEFQAITRHGDDLPGLFKALADAHPRVSLVLAGSKRHLMEELVIHHQAPLFGMAQRLSLGPIPPPEMEAFLRHGPPAQASPSTTPPPPTCWTSPVRYPTTSSIWPSRPTRRPPTASTWPPSTGGMARAVDHDSVLFAENLARLSPGQGRVLAAMAEAPPVEPYAAAFARSAGLASGSSVRKALQPLLQNEDVVERDGRLAVADPFFAAWFRGDSSARTDRRRRRRLAALAGRPPRGSSGVWLVLAKKGTDQPTSLTYDQALDEALCHGWIDGQVRRRDDATYRQRFTPRRAAQRLVAAQRRHRRAAASPRAACTPPGWPRSSRPRPTAVGTPPTPARPPSRCRPT